MTPRDDCSLVAPFGHSDALSFDFVRDNPAIRFRKHYREGLRSRISEVLASIDVEREAKGVLKDGIRTYPRAKPMYMLRVFRRPFDTLEDAFREAKLFSVLENYLGADHVAGSSEFVVNHREGGDLKILLCGYQKYVTGEIFNPWAPMGPGYVESLYQAMPSPRSGEKPTSSAFVARVLSHADDLIRRVKSMIAGVGRSPDLAGIGNLILTPEGNIKLVDINNVFPVTFDDTVFLDDQGYPVCDKSIEVLAILEEKLLGRPLDPDEPLWRHFLSEERRLRATRCERQFRRSLNHPSSAPHACRDEDL